MNKNDNLSHITTIEIHRAYEEVFNFLSSPYKLGQWSLGCLETKETEVEGVYCGTSLFSKEKSYVKITSDKKTGLIDYHVGEPDSLKPVISSRVIPGNVYSNEQDICLVSFCSWRPVHMSDERWHRLCVCHETEVILIKHLIEKIDLV